MSELSPSGGSERYGVCDDEGRGLPGAPDLPLGGKVARPKAVTDEGASVCHVLGGHAGPPLQDGRAGYAVGAAPCGRPQSLPPTGGKVAFAEQMTDEGAEGRTVHHPRGHPHQSRFARQLPPGRGKPLWGAPMCAPRTGGRTRRSAPTDNAPRAAARMRGGPAGLWSYVSGTADRASPS